MSRPRDYAWEALIEVTASDPSEQRGELNAALKSIREQSGIEDSYLLADEIHVRAKMYRQVMPDVMLTPSALAKHWLRVFEEAAQRRTRGTNVSAPATDCETCGGDRWVVVCLRGEIEEYAGCPDCNAVQITYYRADGTRWTSPDPARVREMMKG